MPCGIIDAVASQPMSSESGFKITPRMVIITVVAVMAVIFVFLNRDSTTFSFLLFDLTMPTWIAFLGLLLVGAAIGFFARGKRDKRKATGR